MRFVCTLFVLCWWLTVSSLYAQEEQPVNETRGPIPTLSKGELQSPAALGPRELAQLMQIAHKNMQDMAAYFYQETLAPGNPNPVRAEGHVYMKRPDSMRWDYVKPEPQVVVVNEKAVYVYEKEVNQVMVMNREQFLSAEITRAFFWRRRRIDPLFLYRHSGSWHGSPLDAEAGSHTRQDRSGRRHEPHQGPVADLK